MSAATGHLAGHRREGPALFARFAYPPNELGYCGPQDTHALLDAGDRMTAVAREFDGAWPYLQAIADATGSADPLDAEVVHSYWVGGPALDAVDAATLLERLRSAFTGQVTGLLGDLPAGAPASAHHSFHVLVVYPWVRFLDRDLGTALGVLQNCRIRWGTVVSVDDEHVVMNSRPLALEDGDLALAEPVAERVRWRRGTTALTTAPEAGDVVAAHWDWVCGPLTDADTAALTTATQATLALVNATRSRS